jgi:uncharacterized protein
MKPLFILVLFLAIHHFAKAQNDASISVGKKTTLFSKILNENRRIWIYSPDQTSTFPIPGKKYPVVYVLDGDAHFLSTVGMIQQLSQANGNTIVPEMIVVGIENTNRLRDLTPSLADSGGIKKTNPFINFIETELIPFVEKKYATAPYRILIGHSLGGLTAIDILTNSTNLFNAYLAIDPSMWYENEKHLKNTMSQLGTRNLKGKRLFIGTANTMPAGMSLANLKNDKTEETQHIRSIYTLDKFLKKQTTSSLQYSFKYYEKENHHSVPLISEYDGLRFIFNYYQINITEKELKEATPTIANKYRQHYKRISEELGYKNSPPEAFINYLAYDALSKYQLPRAKALFELNIENFPNSNNVYDSYGDYFIVTKDSLNAITNYKKALAIKKDVRTENKILVLTQSGKYTLSTAELEKYAGVYILDTYKVDVILVLQEGKLIAKVVGQEDDELVPIAKNIFTVKNKLGYTITFQMNESRAISFTSVQPNGIFKANLKNK